MHTPWPCQEKLCSVTLSQPVNSFWSLWCCPTAKPQPFTPQQSRHGCQPPESSIKAMLILSSQKYTMQPQRSAALCNKETTRVLKRARASLSRGQGKQRGLKGSLGSKTQLSTQNAAQRPQLYTEQGTQSLLQSLHPSLAGSTKAQLPKMQALARRIQAGPLCCPSSCEGESTWGFLQAESSSPALFQP